MCAALEEKLKQCCAEHNGELALGLFCLVLCVFCQPRLAAFVVLFERERLFNGCLLTFIIYRLYADLFLILCWSQL